MKETQGISGLRSAHYLGSPMQKYGGVLVAGLASTLIEPK